MDLKRRREVENQLKTAGYAIPEAMRHTQGKCTMYRHKPWMNEVGQVLRACGEAVPNQPVHPDHKARLTLRGLRDWPFRGVCILNPCLCREQMTPEAFDAWMRGHGIADPDAVRPQGVVQAVNAGEVKPDAKPTPIVVNASVAEAKAAEEAAKATVRCKHCGHVETAETRGKALGAMSIHSRTVHPKVPVAA
jgi:hypothetical protein